MNLKILFLINIIIKFIYGKKELANLTDIRKCRFSKDGFDYRGTMARTESGLRCEYWAALNPLHKMDPKIIDSDFPEGSRKEAKNYCRNPRHSFKNPWCYTMSKQVTDEKCFIPMCMFPECRVTGAGFEYSGNIEKSGTEIECVKWNKKHLNPETGKPSKYDNALFPEGSRKKAKNFCRNPDFDPGGPWCFVEIDEDMLSGVLKATAKTQDKENEGKEREFKEYCHPRFCQELECAWFGNDYINVSSISNSSNTTDSSNKGNISTTNIPRISQFTWIPTERVSELIFAVKLWEADWWPDAAIRIILSPWPMVDISGSLSLLITNRQSGLEFGAKENEMKETRNLFPEKVDNWTWFNLRWFQGSLALHQGQDTSKEPIFLVEYPKGKGTVQDLSPGPYNFYAVETNGLFWSTESCLKECEMHVTTRFDWTHWYQIRKAKASWDIHFNLRAARDAAIQLRATPVHPYPHVLIVLQDVNNMTLIQYKHSATDQYTTLGSEDEEDVLSEYQFHEFLISIFGEKMDISITKEGGMQLILRASDYVFRRCRWFSIGSKNTLAYWTFNCKPKDELNLPAPYDPECVSHRTGTHTNFVGKLSRSGNGLPCLPWISPRIPEIFHSEALYKLDGSRLKARDYCRNLDNSTSGLWCFVEEITLKSQPTTIVKQECRPQICQSSECIKAGTGNDYCGTVSITRSQRTCQSWSSNGTHQIPKEDLDDEKFPELDIVKAENFCRNPSKNIGGLWCVTTDPMVYSDLCDITDCDKPAESTVIIRTSEENRFIYITPEFRDRGFRFWIKAWNPRMLDGLTIELFPYDHLRGSKKSYRLDIGAEDNEKINFYYISNGEKKLLKKKTMPHLIPIGKWAGFWLRPRSGDVEFGLAGIRQPLFDWEDDDNNLAYSFKPAFLNYRTYSGGELGVHFPPTDCHTERTATPRPMNLYPIGLWRNKEDGPFNNITFKIRGFADMKIPLITYPGVEKFYGIEIRDNNLYLTSFKNFGNNSTIVGGSVFPSPIFTNDRWTDLSISFTEEEYKISVDSNIVLEYKSPYPILNYFFSVIINKTEVTWTANCDPLDIDGPPRDGGWAAWSKWQCSTTCGGGNGIQTRTCTKPTPNMLGEPCSGEDAFVGQCNMFQCGHLSPDTVALIKHRLQTLHFSIIVDENQPLEIKCDEELVSLVKKQSPEAKINWTLNGAVILEADERFQIYKPEILKTEEAKAWHGGVYVCLLHRIIGRRAALRVITVGVKPKGPTHRERKDELLRLTCDASVLGILYRDLKVSWEHDGVMALDYGTTTPSMVDELKIVKLTKEHKGEWRCLVRQPDLRFVWTTSIYSIEVLPAATFYTHLMEDKLTGWLFGLMGSEAGAKGLFHAIIIIVSILVISAVCLYAYLERKRKQMVTKLRKK